MKKIVLSLIFTCTSFTVIGMEKLRQKLLSTTPHVQTMELETTHTPQQQPISHQENSCDDDTRDCCAICSCLCPTCSVFFIAQCASCCCSNH